jgi:hypothetical protein
MSPAPAGPGLEFAFEERVALSKPLVIGPTAAGLRRVIPIAGGTFEGPKLKGRVLEGGADWQILRNDGIDELHARYTLETDGGALIYVLAQGLRTGPAEIMQRLRSGEVVDPSLYYFRCAVTFETGAPELQWLTRSLFVASGQRYPSEVVIRFWKVL